MTVLGLIYRVSVRSHVTLIYQVQVKKLITWRKYEWKVMEFQLTMNIYTSTRYVGMKIQGFPLPVFMMHPAAWKYKASCDNKLWKFLVSKSKQNPEIPSKIRNYRLRWTLCLRGFAPNNSDSLTINSFCRNIFLFLVQWYLF